MKWVINIELFQSHTKSRIAGLESLDFPMGWSQVGNHQIAEGMFPFLGSICRHCLHSHRHKVDPALVLSRRSGCRIALKKLWPVPLSFWCITSDLNTKCIPQSFKIAVGELWFCTHLLSPSWTDYVKDDSGRGGGWKNTKTTHICASLCLTPLGCWAHVKPLDCSPQQACGNHK